MSKFQLFMAFFRNVRVREFANLLWFMFKNYAEKQYLQDSTLVDELEEMHNRVDQRSRPLSDKTVEALEQLAFTDVGPLSNPENGAYHYDNVHVSTNQVKEKTNEQ